MNTAIKPAPQDVIAEIGGDILEQVRAFMRQGHYVPYAFLCAARQVGVPPSHPRYQELLHAVTSELASHRTKKKKSPLTKKNTPAPQYSFRAQLVSPTGAARQRFEVCETRSGATVCFVRDATGALVHVSSIGSAGAALVKAAREYVQVAWK